MLWIILSFFVFFVLAAVFTPRIGLLAWLKSRRELQRREQVEDALKHLLERSQAGRQASPESLAGTLGISVGKATGLIARMQALGLVEPRGVGLHLTIEGERWALHVMRAHRLWERYLADEARMPLQRVHGEAHRREHAFSDADLDALDASLGHPQFDPHGDPIPNRQGQLPAAQSTPLTDWQVDRPGVIVHLEDEPALAYQQILASGLHPGQAIRLLATSPERYVLSDGENEVHLAPAVAANIFLAPPPELESIAESALPLSGLVYDQRAEIVGLDDRVQGFSRRRFLDLGLTPGTLIYPELKTFFGDPRAYRVRGTLIALRKDQAELIWVKPV